MAAGRMIKDNLALTVLVFVFSGLLIGLVVGGGVILIVCALIR
jgi:hypothetical protein